MTCVLQNDYMTTQNKTPFVVLTNRQFYSHFTHFVQIRFSANLTEIES